MGYNKVKSIFLYMQYGKYSTGSNVTRYSGLFYLPNKLVVTSDKWVLIEKIQWLEGVHSLN